MSSRYYSRQANDAMELMEFSDAEEIYSIDEADNKQREYNDLRLRQAINYIAEEGGNDSPVTYMSRIDRIDEALVQLLPQTGNDFDSELYRTVRAMVDEVHEEYDNAIQDANLPVISAEHDAEYYTPSSPEALYRLEDDAPEPSTRHTRVRPTMSGKSVLLEQAESFAKLQQPPVHPSAAPAVTPLSPRPRDSQDNVDVERSWKDGGSDNNVEQWYRNMPASLPFPETHQLEAWETLKINFDVSEYGKKLKAEGKVVETTIPFNHPALQKYKNLHHFESGSKFKLPHGRQEDYDRIRRLASQKQLTQTVDECNEGSQAEEEAEEEASDYAPRTFLGRFSIGKQSSPAPDLETALRDALSRTPTKSPRSSAVTMPSTISFKTTGIKAAALKAAEEARKSSIAAVQEQRAKNDASEQGITDTNPSSHGRPVSHFPSARHGSSRARSTTPARPTTRAGAAMRKFGDERKQALSQSPRRESLMEGALGTPESPSSTRFPRRPTTPTVRPAKTTPKKSTPSPRATNPSPKVPTTSPKAPTSAKKTPSHVPTPFVAKKHRGRPRKNSLSATSTTESPNVPVAPEAPVAPIIPTPSEPTPPRLHPAIKSSNKRKRSLGSEYYTPDGKRRKSVGSEEFTPLTKILRSATKDKSASRSTTPKKVDFVEVMSSGESESDDCVGGKKRVRTHAVKRQKKQGDVGRGVVASVYRKVGAASETVGGVSKAVAAGKQVKKRVIRETVVESTTKVRKIIPSGLGVAKTD